jgi:hypothetical protein
MMIPNDKNVKIIFEGVRNVLLAYIAVLMKTWGRCGTF